MEGGGKVGDNRVWKVVAASDFQTDRVCHLVIGLAEIPALGGGWTGPLLVSKSPNLVLGLAGRTASSEDVTRHPKFG